MDQPRGTHNLWGPLHLPHKKSSPSIRNIPQKRLGYFAFTSAVKENEVAEAPQGAEVGLKAVPALLGLQCSLVGSRLSHTRVEESVGSETAKAQCQSLEEGPCELLQLEEICATPPLVVKGHARGIPL